MDSNAFNPPSHILGYTIRSRTRIYVCYLIPTVLELAVYTSQIVTDCAMSYQHFHTQQPEFGYATMSLILIPPVLTFLFVLCSKSQWDNPRYSNRQHFVGFQLLQMVFFPFFAVYRFMSRVFWSVEALFHDDDDVERMKCLAKVTQCSTCELYHLIQAYGQSAPQIILQLYHMLSQDLFRDYETTTVQAISLVFSAINLAVITTSYQRFESQRRVGRVYPWSAPDEEDAQRRLLAENKRLCLECEAKRRDSQRAVYKFPESDIIMANFYKRKAISANEPSVIMRHTHTMLVERNYDEVDIDVESSAPETTALLHNPTSAAHNATDDDKMHGSPKLAVLKVRQNRSQLLHVDSIEVLDMPPDIAAPLPPPLTSEDDESPKLRDEAEFPMHRYSHQKRTSNALSQLDIFKDMLIVNAQLYIKEHLPHPPKMLINRVQQADEKESAATNAASPSTPTGFPNFSVDKSVSQDVTDFFIPRSTRRVNGIEQDDFAGKIIAFFGWISYIIMRMLSLASFCAFYPKAFFVVLSVHYALMLGALCLESRFKGNFNRTLSYLLMAYVYIFVLLEFRIQFKRVRLWLVGYFILVMAENICLTMIWYIGEEFESWWFDFIFQGIIYSGILLVATLVVYYCILKPKDVVILVEEAEAIANNSTT